MTLALFGGQSALRLEDHRAWPAIGEGHRRAVARVLDRGVLSGSTAPESVALEREFARFVGAKNALLTQSGTSALHLALAASGIGTGDHVLVPAYSFVATPLAVLQAGAIPIFVDVDDVTGLMGSRAAAEAMTSRTRAMMPVHVHGCAADLGPLLDLAERRRLVLIEDAAQAHGATWSDRPVGSIGRAGGFSLQSSKHLGVGEGGILVTNDDALAEEANRIRNFGQAVALADREPFDVKRPLDTSRPVESVRLGWMARGNELAAALGRAGLAELPESLARCRENAERLSRALRELPGVTPPLVPPQSTSVHHKFRVKLDPVAGMVDVEPRVLRDAMLRALRAEGLEVVLWQTSPLPAQPVFQRREGFGGGWPWSSDRETDFSTAYDPRRFPRTQRLLDGSLLLFSQSYPLIAQSSAVVDRYAETFARVWHERAAIVARAKREDNTRG